VTTIVLTRTSTNAPERRPVTIADERRHANVPDSLLRADGVDFSYSRRRRRSLFSSLDWAVTPGKTTLLLGPNGAGKSTLLKLLAGYERPTHGRVTYQGDSSRSGLFASVGWMPQHIEAARGLTAIEQLEYAAWVGGSSRKEARAISRSCLDLVQLSDKAGTRSTQLSGGQLRRLGLAQALVRRAPVLLLDEPTAGLDPAQSINFRSILRQVESPGGIVVSTHQVADIADDVDRVAVLTDGRFVFDGTVDEFRDYGTRIGACGDSLAGIFTQLVKGGLH
jgi:ABC-2 type transport system ATP-binding protein